MATKATIRQNRYDKAHTKQYLLKMHLENDADIIEKLSSVPSMQGYIKQLIREDITKSVPKSDITVLHENSKGIKIVRKDYKNRSKVNVIGLDGKTLLCTYRFNNIPEYKHPYLSWENLDHCGGWASDDAYLLTAVQSGKKPAAQYVEVNAPVPNIEPENGIETYYMSDQICDNYTRNQVYITRTCSLKDLFDIDSIIDAYKKHDIFLDREELMPYMERPIMDLMKEEFFINTKSETELVITGLMLGYPIESTASILMGY